MTGKNHLRLRFRLDIPAEDYLAYYRGIARDVIARTLDGRRIRFPANSLRDHVRHDGVRGLFEIEFDERHKLVALRRLGD